MDEAEIRGQLREWIRAHARGGSSPELDDETPILEDGLLSSLDVVELILFVEELRGEEVDVESLEPEVMESVNTLYDAFFRKGDEN